ncbi:hypothetical protein OAN72_00905 [bacterium]|nr:hypothetical protein [bacterium]
MKTALLPGSVKSGQMTKLRTASSEVYMPTTGRMRLVVDVVSGRIFIQGGIANLLQEEEIVIVQDIPTRLQSFRILL